MTTETIQAVIEELDDLLDREREALLSGDLEAIGRILAVKESLIDRVNACEQAGPAELDGVQGKLTRNQALLAGAMEGIRAVADRMADLRRIRQGLETYDSKGRKTRYPTQSGGTVERRA